MEQTIGQRLAELRKKSGLTQNELAEKLMVSNKAVSKWESDNGNPSMEFLPQLAKILNCSLDYLITGSEHKPDIEDINNDYKLPIHIGKNDTKTFIGDITVLSQTMIFGESGTGKSNFLHNVLLDLMNYKMPSEVNFAIIDSKYIEFTQYNNIPYLFKPIARSKEEIKETLKSCLEEMNRRYELIDGLNAINSEEGVTLTYRPDPSMPYLVIIIDELIECLQDKENITNIAKLLQLGRSMGVYLLVATQSLDIEQIPNSIINGISSRISFRLPNEELSKKFIEVAGAEKLNEPGEMLFKTYSCRKPYLLKAKYIKDSDIKKAIENIEYFK